MEDSKKNHRKDSRPVPIIISMLALAISTYSFFGQKPGYRWVMSEHPTKPVSRTVCPDDAGSAGLESPVECSSSFAGKVFFEIKERNVVYQSITTSQPGFGSEGRIRGNDKLLETRGHACSGRELNEKELNVKRKYVCKWVWF